MMKTISKALKYLAAIACVGLVASNASAIIIDPTSGVLNTSRWEGNQNDQSGINAAIASIIGTSTELYKQNVGGAEEKAFAASYTTTFLQSSEPSDAVIKWDGPDIIGETAFLLVKDGHQEPAWYLFNLTAIQPTKWNGTEDLILLNFWPGHGAISHISLYGGGRTTVPDGGSMLFLLGGAVTVLGFLRRKISA